MVLCVILWRRHVTFPSKIICVSFGSILTISSWLVSISSNFWGTAGLKNIIAHAHAYSIIVLYVLHCSVNKISVTQTLPRPRYLKNFRAKNLNTVGRTMRKTAKQHVEKLTESGKVLCFKRGKLAKFHL